ncbi:MAG: endonuclease/exonuclease/phosphatase family protein [Luteolibacter sp.]
MNFRAALLLILLAPIAQGVGFRLATFNIGAHLVVPTDGGAAYFDYGIGAPGQPDHDKVRDVLARINADVVALEEIHSTDVDGNPDDVDALAASLGYGYSYISPATNAFDNSLRVIFLSRYPFITTAAVGSPAGAREITRLFPVVKVDIPGTTNDPTILALHLKSGTSSADRFRRAVEMKRVVGYINSQGITADDNFIILGDFNPSSINKTFTALPAGLPTSFVLGSDLPFPISYSTNPLTYFTGPVPVKLDPRQLNNSASTYDTTTTAGPILDLFLVSPAIAGRPHSQEVYNSTLDTSNSVGLPKAGSPPAADSSVLASDHYAVFADLDLDLDYPNLSASLSAGSVNENTASGTVMLSVTLPAVRATPLTISVSSDDHTAASLSAATLTIPAGSTTGSVPIITARNFITDETRSVTFTASANGYDPANAVLQVVDADQPYSFTSPGQTITENFTTFTGNHDPAPWITTGGAWRGMDDGGTTTTGFRSYGSTGDGSIGFVADGAPFTATVGFINNSPETLTAVQIAFTAEQWKVFPGGRADTLTADLVVNGIPQAVPSLTFTAATDLPTGAIAGGTSTVETAIVSGLSIAPGNSFDLRFTLTPGAGGAIPGDVFINEFHYDNAGADSSEFVEVVVGPAYMGALSDVSLILYNGSDGINYGTHLLSTFTAGAVTSSGHRIFSKLIPSIQNGDPDGFALAVGGMVKQFISYGGSFLGTAGAASGMTSTNIGVKQSAEIAGQASLGLTGTGGTPAAFIWTKFTGSPYTIGQPNTGQTLTIPAQPQGIAIDDLSVTFLEDTDLDADNDGLTDTDEALFGSNPLDGSSVYHPAIAQTAADTITLSFATLVGRKYVVESSEDLTTWMMVSTQNGTGSTLSQSFSNSTPHVFYRVAVSYE